MRSGVIDLPVVTGAFRGAGQIGHYWSSRGSSAHSTGATLPSGYYLRFDATVIIPSNGPTTRYDAYSLRCLSTVLDIWSGG